MSLIVSIDVGVKNLAICAYDLITNRIVHWDNVSLVNGRYIPSLNVSYVRQFVEKHAEIFDNAMMVVIERHAV